MVAIFPKLCLWRRSLCSNLGGIDPERRTKESISKNFLQFAEANFSIYECTFHDYFSVVCPKHWKNSLDTASVIFEFSILAHGTTFRCTLNIRSNFLNFSQPQVSHRLSTACLFSSFFPIAKRKEQWRKKSQSINLICMPFIVRFIFTGVFIFNF